MKKIIRTTIVCLLIPSFVFAQPYPYRSNEKSIKQTDLARVWNALNTEVGQQIVSSIETTVGSINLEQAKAFTTAEGEIAFVPIKSFSNELAALCYRHLEDGSEYLFLITYNAVERGVSFTFPSGRMYVMQASGAKESINPHFQFQPYDDLNNKVSMTDANSLRICNLARIIAVAAILVGLFYLIPFNAIFCKKLDERCDRYLKFVILSVPFLLITPAYLYENSTLMIISILFAAYYYGCNILIFAG